MKVISIKGYESHLFKEGDGYLVNFENRNTSVKSSNGKYKKVSNNNKVEINFNGVDDLRRFKETQLDQKYEEIIREDKDYKVKPYIDKELSLVTKKKTNTVFKKNYGYYDGNELFLELDDIAYQDRPNLNLVDFVKLDESNIENFIYPIRFNTTSYHRRGGKIDPLNALNEIKRYNFGVDKIKGFRGFATKNGSNALQENNKIEGYFVRKNIKSFPFEDGILEGIIYNDLPLKKIDSINYDYNPITKEVFNKNTIYKTVYKLSNEPRYVTFQQQNILPYNDIDQEKNNPTIFNDSQIYLNKLSDNNMNDILLSNKTSYNVIEEEKLYMPAGKSIDYSISQGLESIIFYESID